MGKRRTCTNTFEFISRDRVAIVACSCPEKTYLHVHCLCEQCKRKATSRKVELEHWKRSQLLRVKRVKQDENLHESDTTFSNQEQETPQESNLDVSEEERYFSVDNDTPESLEEISERIDSSNKNNLDEHDDIPTNCLDKTIVKAVVKAMQIMENTKASQNSFQDILDFEKELFCEGLGEECDMDIDNSVWPSSWEEAQVVLCRVGYKNPKGYYVCFC